MKRIELVFDCVKALCEAQLRNQGMVYGVTTTEVAVKLGIQRSNASSDLNVLVRRGKLEKIKGKPVLYRVKNCSVLRNESGDYSVFDEIIGANGSLKKAISQAKAAILYPTMDLHTLLVGETGVGKSLFAEAMALFAKQQGRIREDAPFVSFNCADYAHNPQLLMAQLFGVRKGSYTGATKDKTGLVKKADGGILFLDEVHRLPPEGQEMLFQLIDKGSFRRLGEVDKCEKAKVFIICATTESPDSSLLRTFLRRIPVIIELPPLRERPLEERWHLIESFFREEAQHLDVPIVVTANAMKALLLYDCPNNVGQLKNDVKMSCAKAFVDRDRKPGSSLQVEIECLPERVRRGLLKYKESKDKLHKLGITDRDIVFHGKNKTQSYIQTGGQSINFYRILEERVKVLREKGVSEREIRFLLDLEIDTLIKKYLLHFNRDNLRDLYQEAVDHNVLQVVKEFVAYATKMIGKQFGKEVVHAMAAHITGTLARLENGQAIFNPNLEEIKNSYHQEFKVASKMAEMLYKKLKVKIPEDEVGFITMFLVLNDYMYRKPAKRVGVIVAMHGESTAKSMADVANKLLGEDYVKSYDMPLEQNPLNALEDLMKLVKETDQGEGVLLLVDMGTLVFLGDIIYEKTNIPIKVIEMASTPMVIEAALEASAFSSLEQVYHKVTNVDADLRRINQFFNSWRDTKEKIIVTACFTGEGTARIMKKIIEKHLAKSRLEATVVPLQIDRIDEYNRKLENVCRKKRVVAVISNVEPSNSKLVCISPREIINGSGLKTIEQEIKQMDLRENVIDSITNIIREEVNIDCSKYLVGFEKFLKELSLNGFFLNEDTAIGLGLHLACVFERILNGNSLHYGNTEDLKKELDDETREIISKAFSYLEDVFKIKVPQDEYAYVNKLIHMVNTD